MDKLKTKLKENRNALIILVLVLLGFWVYQKSGTDIEPLVKVIGQEESQLIGSELVLELERLKSLNNIDVEFFDSTVFRSLEDMTVEVSPQPIGRENPFVPQGF